MFIKSKLQTLWKTEKLFTILLTDKTKHSCGFAPLFHNFFAYYYCY